jgi:hypothetical protein
MKGERQRRHRAGETEKERPKGQETYEERM